MYEPQNFLFSEILAYREYLHLFCTGYIFTTFSKIMGFFMKDSIFYVFVQRFHNLISKDFNGFHIWSYCF
jgi:hypothetical protein